MQNKYIKRKNRKLAFFLMIFFLLALSGCNSNGTKIVKIAVMGNSNDFYPGYKEGVERAVEDLNKEYADSGYQVECSFYNGQNYEDGAAVIDTVVSDASVTAVIGAIDMELNKTAAELCEQNSKLLVVPYFLYDSVYQDNRYDFIFSMCNSGEYVGHTLRHAAAASGKSRWAICAANRAFELEETNGFLQHDAADGIQVVDCVNMTATETNFDEIYKRWEILGVEGVMMFPENEEGFELLKKLKQKNPALICGGDTAFDNSTRLDEDEELQRAMTGFIMADEFILRDETNEEAIMIQEMAKEYFDKTGLVLDTWYIQGYNAVRMIGDTAIRAGTTNTMEIAQLLHKEGYSGFCQEFHFSETGAQILAGYQYTIFDESGYGHEYKLDN